MTHVVTLDLPGDLAIRAEAFASRAHQRLEDVLLEWLTRGADDIPVAALSDEEVVALSEQQLNESDQRDLSDLLARQREGMLDAEEGKRLDGLMRAYRATTLRKIFAVREAVKRGLRHPQLIPRTEPDDDE